MTGIAALVSALGGIYALSRQQGGHEAGADMSANVQAAASRAAEAQADAQKIVAAEPAAKPDKPAEAAPAPAPPPHWPDIAGGWQTSFGPLDFKVTDVLDDAGAVVGQASRAIYTSGGETGHIAAEWQGSTLVGNWYEPNSARKCGSERGGTWYWGRLELNFNRAVNEVQGHWGYCEDVLDLTFTGTRV